MKENSEDSSIVQRNSLNYFINPQNWWAPLLFIVVISIIGVGLIGYQTYNDAPPMSGFKSLSGEIVVSRASIIKGQEVFHKYALMEYGSLFGDGAQRGPDFTAESLHLIAVYMSEFYIEEFKKLNLRHPKEMESKAILENVKIELKENRYDSKEDIIILTNSQIYAFNKLKSYYKKIFFTNSDNHNLISKINFKRDEEAFDLASFFYWSAWVCVTKRPLSDFSYTHNWPFDPDAGNNPTTPTILWSVLGLLAFVLCCGIVLYFIGQFHQIPNRFFKAPEDELLTLDKVNNFKPTSTQRATFKFFYVAIILFLIQVFCGILTLNDFINFFEIIGIHPSSLPSVNITRSWHLMLSLYWISTCWIASSIFILPILSKKEIPGQLKLINLLFWLLFILVLGSLIGMFMGPKGWLGDWWYWFGHQGWEFVDFGRIYQFLLMVIFILWGIIVYRGVKPAWIKNHRWEIPNWIFYSVLGIPILFISGFVSSPETNFVIADFWRWMVIHMWVEAFFEVFVTVIVSYLMVIMGLVSRAAAIRVIYFATILFLGTGLLGISHNFYWNAKPVATMALGSIFSTMQFVPLILLTVEAWRFKNMPSMSIHGYESKNLRNFGFQEVFLFLIAVNFWNFFGAGVMGIIINLPIMNYYEHGTYLTINHGHAALMGVYGNISLAALIFASKLLINSTKWNRSVIIFSFWSINAGLMLMVLLDLFPAGILQFKTVVEKGFWFARSSQFIEGSTFKSLTWMRGIGATLFFFGGILPIAWFILSRWGALKEVGGDSPKL